MTRGKLKGRRGPSEYDLPITIFSGHYVDAGKGPEVYVPLRVVANADGAEILLTLFRQPGMSEQQFLADIEWVKRDLTALKALLE